MGCAFVMRSLRYCEIGAANMMIRGERRVAFALRHGVFLLESFIACLGFR
jgi:hypothetical protein